MSDTSSPQHQNDEPAISIAHGSNSHAVERGKSVQNKHRVLLKPWLWGVSLAIVAVVILAAVFSNHGLWPALFPTPALAPSATPANASLRPTLAPGRLAAASTALLWPADLTFNGTYSLADWQRCDDYSVDKTLVSYRAMYHVATSAAAIWEHGSGCNHADQNARLDEYVWLLESDYAATDLSGALNAASTLNNLSPSSGNQFRQFEREGVMVRTLDSESSSGQRQYAAEIIGQAGPAVISIHMTTATVLSDEDYVGLARLSLERIHAGQAGK